MEQREVKLKPCPFCKGEASACVGENNFSDVTIRCDECHATGPIFDGHEGELDAVARELNMQAAEAAWNKRVPDPLVQQMAQALEEAQTALNNAAMFRPCPLYNQAYCVVSAALKAWQESQQ